MDTNSVIKYLNQSLPEAATKYLDGQLDRESNISLITRIELLAWNPPKPSDMEVVQDFVDNSSVIPISEAVIAKTIELRKASKVKLPDCLIAATAIVHNLTLVADNDKDFNQLVPLGLMLLNPMSIH